MRHFKIGEWYGNYKIISKYKVKGKTTYQIVDSFGERMSELEYKEIKEMEESK